MPPSAPLANGTIIAGKLRIVRLLGAGGMAAVYEVEHQLTKHRRALKLLHPEMLKHPSVVARFLREASAAGHIGNDHVVETFDAGTLDGGEPYIVMEMLVGEALADRFTRDRRLSLVDLADLVGQACEGVEAAHTAGIVHRDLKPDNIFLVDRAGAIFVKVLDFGISKFDPALTGGHGMTKEGVTIGTPYYMSPEQVNGSTDVDARADVYALGVILYEGAAGARPFEADALPLLSVLIHQGNPRPLGELRPDLPPAFLDVVRRAMATDREERYQSARDLAADLAPFRASTLDATIPEGTIGVSPTGPPRAIVRPSSSRPPPSRPSGSQPVAAVTLPSDRSDLIRAHRSAPPPDLAAAAAAWPPVATTDAGAAHSVAEPAERASRGKAAWIAGGVVALAALGLVVKAAIGGGSASTGPTPAALVQLSAVPAPEALPPAASATASAPVPALAGDAGAPPSSGAVDVATAAAGAPRSVPVAASSAAAPRASASASGKPASSTRVDQKGLAGDNPF